MAAWCPCATAQMMFFGPHAASPPKKTPGRVDWNVVLSTVGMPHLSNSIPRSRSIQGNAFSWPIARITSSAGRNTSSITREFLRLGVPFQPLELHAFQHAVFDHEALRRVVDDDLDAFFFGIIQFPRRRLEVSARAARHHLDIFPAQPARRPAAIHGRVADADDQNPFADLVDVPERDRFQPVDADVDAIRILAARQIEFLAARRAGADEHRVVAILKQRLAGC